MANSTVAQRKDLVDQVSQNTQQMLAAFDRLRSIIKAWDVLTVGAELQVDELPTERLVADYTAAITSLKALDTALGQSHGLNLYKVIPNVKL